MSCFRNTVLRSHNYTRPSPPPHVPPARMPEMPEDTSRADLSRKLPRQIHDAAPPVPNVPQNVWRTQPLSSSLRLPADHGYRKRRGVTTDTDLLRMFHVRAPISDPGKYSHSAPRMSALYKYPGHPVSPPHYILRVPPARSLPRSLPAFPGQMRLPARLPAEIPLQCRLLQRREATRSTNYMPVYGALGSPAHHNAAGSLSPSKSSDPPILPPVFVLFFSHLFCPFLPSLFRQNIFPP